MQIISHTTYIDSLLSNLSSVPSLAPFLSPPKESHIAGHLSDGTPLAPGSGPGGQLPASMGGTADIGPVIQSGPGSTKKKRPTAAMAGGAAAAGASGSLSSLSVAEKRAQQAGGASLMSADGGQASTSATSSAKKRKAPPSNSAASRARNAGEEYDEPPAKRANNSQAAAKKKSASTPNQAKPSNARRAQQQDQDDDRRGAGEGSRRGMEDDESGGGSRSRSSRTVRTATNKEQMSDEEDGGADEEADEAAGGSSSSRPARLARGAPRPGNGASSADPEGMASSRTTPGPGSAAAGAAGAGADDSDERRYCFCNNVSYGDMIGCDDEDCEREWVSGTGPARPSESSRRHADSARDLSSVPSGLRRAAQATSGPVVLRRLCSQASGEYAPWMTIRSKERWNVSRLTVRLPLSRAPKQRRKSRERAVPTAVAPPSKASPTRLVLLAPSGDHAMIPLIRDPSSET